MEEYYDDNEVVHNERSPDNDDYWEKRTHSREGEFIDEEGNDSNEDSAGV